MTKNIIIIGGGISGLSLLHYLKRKHVQDDARILLIEKNDHLGGTIRTIARGGCLFETGPNGFLDSKKRTLDFVKEVGLEDSLVRANEESKIRYLSVDNILHPLPTNPQSFLAFSLLNPIEKMRVLGEMFIPRGNDPDESVYDFGKRRFGEKFSQVFLDPMVSGVYAGDARRADLKTVFPRIAALEQEHGSLFKAMLKIRKARKAQGNGSSDKGVGMGSPMGTLTSFRAGIGQVIEQVGMLYKDSILLGQGIGCIVFKDGRYSVSSSNGTGHQADELYICAPSYCAGPMLQSIDQKLSQALEKVYYAPVVVIGFVCPEGLLPKRPNGFGYLIPSSQKKEILGVLFENNIFSGRCPKGQAMFRIMIGGARHPDIIRKSREELIRMALEELTAFTVDEATKIREEDLSELFFVSYDRAIPQYDHAYGETRKIIDRQLDRHPRLHLLANYLNGVSLNDCIENAYRAAQWSSINR